MLALGCAKKPESSPAGSAAPVAVPSAVPAASASAPVAAASASPSASDAVELTNLAPGELEIEAKAPTSLEVAAEIERRSPDGKWEPLQNLDLGAGYRLVEQCGPALIPTAPEAGACVELAPGHAFHPVPFKGLGCSAQCNGTCRGNAWEGPGKFRFVVRECGSTARFVGPVFELPDAELVRGLPRWGVTSEVAEASAARLELPSADWSAESAPTPERIAGFGLRSGTEAPLEPATLASLLELLRAPKGFDDDVVKRCAMKHLVGFRFVRHSATTGASRKDLVELALDFNCQKLFLVRGGAGGAPRRVHATHFDPSRAGFLALVKRALPNDKELAKLR